MDYELISESDFEALPEEPEAKFVALARIAHASVARLLDLDHSSSSFTTEVRTQFIETMRSAAEALGIPGLPSEQDMFNMSEYEEYRYFCTKLSGIVTRVRLQTEFSSAPFSVQLGKVTKARIRQEAEHLRVYIEASDLPKKKKKLVSGKLDDLLIELDKKRMSFAQVAAVTAAIATTLAGGTTAVAKAPEAYDAINRILAAIGEDKEREEAERERLSPPPVALPSPPASNPTQRPMPVFDSDLDDDVPF